MRRRIVRALCNPRVRRLRLPWRLLGGIGLFVGLGFVLTSVLDASLGSFVTVVTAAAGTREAGVAARNVVVVGSQALLTLVSVYLAGRYLDRRWVRDFGFRIDRDWWIDLGFGGALGAGLVTAVFAVELLVGWLTVTDTYSTAQPAFAFWPWFAWSFVTFVAVGVYEEVLARGYLLKNLAEGFTWVRGLGVSGAVWLAVGVSAIAFGAGHAMNPNATLASGVGIAVAALMLAVGYVLTGELAIPLGIHVTWNFFQGPVFGFPVSGFGAGLTLLATEQGAHRSRPAGHSARRRGCSASRRACPGSASPSRGSGGGRGRSESIRRYRLRISGPRVMGPPRQPVGFT